MKESVTGSAFISSMIWTQAAIVLLVIRLTLHFIPVNKAQGKTVNVVTIDGLP